MQEWTHNGGDLPAASRAAAAGGVYVHLQVEPLGTFMAGDLAGEVRAAWDALIAALPGDAVAIREGMFSIGAVMRGDRSAAKQVARAVMAVMGPRERMPPYRIALVLVAIDPAEPEAAIEVDVTDDLQDVEGDAIAWVSGNPPGIAFVRP